MFRSRRLTARCLAGFSTALLLAGAGESRGAVFSPSPRLAIASPDASRISMASACWIVPGANILSPATAIPPHRKTRAARSSVTPRSHHKVHRVVKPARPRKAAVRRAASARVAAPRVECVLFEPQTVGVEPFAETMARLMEPAAVDERKIQKLVQKRQRRVRRRAERVVVSAAPEPASWLMMIAGFGAIGLMLRRRRRVAIGLGGTIGNRWDR